jgi:hypothetical protein
MTSQGVKFLYQQAIPTNGHSLKNPAAVHYTKQMYQPRDVSVKTSPVQWRSLVRLAPGESNRNGHP